MPKFVKRMTGLIVTREGADIFSEETTHLEIVDDSSGEYVKVSQVHSNSEDGTIKITLEEWEALRDAIDQLINECRV